MNDVDVCYIGYIPTYGICEEALYWPIHPFVSVGVSVFVSFTQYGASGNIHREIWETKVTNDVEEQDPVWLESQVQTRRCNRWVS